MTGPTRTRVGLLVVLTSLIGAVAATVLGFLTFGAQATANPDGIPVAVAAPPSGPLAQAAQQVTQRPAGPAGGAVEWRVTTPREGRDLLEDKEVYGVLELAGGPTGVSATVVVSGAINPMGTQMAQQVLTGAGQGLTAAVAQSTGTAAAPVRVETVHATSAAGRAAPLGLTVLAWIGGLAAGAALTVLAMRQGATVGPLARFSQLVLVSVLATGVLVGFAYLWDSSLDLGWQTVAFLGLTVSAFAALQSGLLRVLGIRAMAILVPLYLLAPSVASQVPEMLHSAYRTWLWSWTPFRFSSEGLRSLLTGAHDAPDVMYGVWVLGGMLLAGLILVLWPRRRGSAAEEAEPQAPDGVVDVGVDEAERLPGAQRHGSAEYGDARIRR